MSRIKEILEDAVDKAIKTETATNNATISSTKELEILNKVYALLLIEVKSTVSEILFEQITARVKTVAFNQGYSEQEKMIEKVIDFFEEIETVPSIDEVKKLFAFYMRLL